VPHNAVVQEFPETSQVYQALLDGIRREAQLRLSKRISEGLYWPWQDEDLHALRQLLLNENLIRPMRFTSTNAATLRNRAPFDPHRQGKTCRSPDQT